VQDITTVPEGKVALLTLPGHLYRAVDYAAALVFLHTDEPFSPGEIEGMVTEVADQVFTSIIMRQPVACSRVLLFARGAVMRVLANRGFGKTHGRDLDSFPGALATFVLVGWLSACRALQCNLPALAKQMLQDESVIAHVGA
jgi:hypothetical protein